MLAPLAEIAPDWRISGVRIAEALTRLDQAGIEKLAPPAAPWRAHFIHAEWLFLPEGIRLGSPPRCRSTARRHPMTEEDLPADWRAWRDPEVPDWVNPVET